MKTYKIAVPAGIGDVSWIWSKLSTIKDARFEIYTPDTYPQRTFGWMDLLGYKVVPMIGKHGYNDILMQEILKDYTYNNTWEEILSKHEPDDVIYLQPNQWFLQGRSLESWIPDLKTDFHYPIYLSVDVFKVVKNWIGNIELPIGIHMASIKGARAWKAWMPNDWSNFISIMKEKNPKATFILLGGSWDLDMALEVRTLLGKEFDVLDLVGKTSIGSVIEILKRLTYYVGYSSGLNVMMNVLDKPCTALWPDWQNLHMNCHVEPRMVENRDYMGFVYDNPEKIARYCDVKLKEILNGKA